MNKMRAVLCILGLIVITLGAYYASKPSREAYLSSLKQNEIRQVYIVSHGWHVGVVLPVNKIPQHLLPEKTMFKNPRYLEIGWGDSGFYQADTITLNLAAKALLKPSRSVVHVVGFKEAVKAYFPEAKIVRLDMNKENFNKLVGFIHNSFARNNNNPAKAFRTGRYGFSYFFEGVGSYHLFRTCNRWVAESLSHSETPIHTFYVATADSLMSQVKTYGNIVR